MRLSSCFGVSQSNLEQPSRDLLAPVRDLNDLSVVCNAWWTVGLLRDGARRPDVPATVGRPYGGHRSMFATSLPMYGRPVLGRINGDLEIANGTWLSPVINIVMLLEADMVCYCGIMGTLDEGAGARARDSTRAVAPRPGSRVDAGAGNAFGRRRWSLRDSKRVPFMTICPELSRDTFADGHHGKGRLAPENAHNEGIGRGTQTGTFAAARRDRKVPSCIILVLSHTCITISRMRL